MKISLKKGHIQIINKDTKLLLHDKITVDHSEYDIVIANEINPNKDFKGFLINSPGEYEAFGFMIQTQPSPNSGKIALISLDIEGVNVIFLRSDSVIPSKKMLDQLGVNHILIIEDTQASSKIRDLVDEFSPQFLIPIGASQEELLAFSKKMGIVLPESQKTFNVTYEDINEDEDSKTLNIVLLD